MTSTKELVDNYYTFLKERDREGLLSLLSEDIVITYHSQPGQFPWSGQFHGIEGFDRFFSILKQHLNVLNVDIVDSIVQNNKMVNQCMGQWEYKSSGYVVKASMVNIFTVTENKITGYDVYADTAAFAVGWEAQPY